ncbi:CPCC family cysteine-rich protein [Winogradskya humida]|uniref:Cysteine-rich CPCC domain-containing protein n=1 Tax=Winogradskya humida TaxID=113566 RepID=A0ABQ3ZGT5_9ACTN|nr:CPCC family cysteine-rich protein [Actinoplanes humidus]GIE17786.1 hypothetical protein Ahu01nite_008880 [Actinoplanes humidus]
MKADDLQRAARMTIGALEPLADRDWSVPAGTLDWTCRETLTHLGEVLAATPAIAELAVAEMLLHTYDITQGLGVRWRPPAWISRLVLLRLAPEALVPRQHPTSVLLRYTGRIGEGGPWQWRIGPEPVPDPDADRYACPCCGQATLAERGQFQICRECWWEDDGQDDHNSAVVMGGPNGSLSLDAARAEYARRRP